MSSLLNVENTQHNSATTPGWNDPPPVNTINQSGFNNNSRVHLLKLRRPVDPSIQSPNTTQKEVSLTPGSANFHQSQSFPQLTKPEVLRHSLGTHPGSAFIPTSVGSLLSTPNSSPHHYVSRNSIGSNSGNPPQEIMQQQQQPSPILHPTPLHLNVQSLVASSPPSMAPNLPQPPAVLAPSPQSIPIGDLISNGPPFSAASQQHKKQIVNQTPVPSFHAVSNTLSPNPVNSNQQQFHQQVTGFEMPQIPCSLPPTMMVGEAPVSFEQPQPLLFSPPNIVPLNNLDKQCRPITQPIPSDYRTPVKAAGDVSLSGPQLVAFLTKASLLLQQGPMREGIQLRINQLGDFVHSQQISEYCLKKLNFVVDAIDRRVYDEASQFFEQMQVTYAEDCALGGWAHGIRLLIHELRSTPQRAHSAGARHF